MSDKDSVRRFVHVRDTMKRCHGEMERYLFAAEISCTKLCYDDGMDCVFWKLGCGCILPRIRQLVGEHHIDGIKDTPDQTLGLDGVEDL